MKTVVIGNGQCALNNRNGEFIDKCDRVVRVNTFTVDGYQGYVGSKLDVY